MVILIASVSAHALFIVALQWVEPARRPVQVRQLRLTTPAPVVVRPSSGEPRRPIDWCYELRLSQSARVRALEPLDAADAWRLRQIYERAHQLYPYFAGRSPRPAQAFELRLVPFETLNSPSYFAVGGDHQVLGLYYPASNITYLTPLSLTHANHLVHELAHHFADVYELRYGDVYEEAHARRFEQFVGRFERLLVTPHVHRHRLPSWPAWEAEAQETVVDELLIVRSRNLLHPKTKHWLRETTRLATTLFGASTGVPEPARRALELRIVDDAELADREHFGPRRGRTFAHYYPRQAVLYATSRILGDAEVLSHYLAHHLVAGSAVSLDGEAIEQLAYGFAWDVDRHLQYEVGALVDKPLAAAAEWNEDPMRVRTRAASILERLGRRSRGDRLDIAPRPR